jgi:hypothetical protein
VPDSFSLGNIPPLTAWEGETLSFNVKTSLGDRTRFTKRATPSPKGKMSIDEKTGAFTYAPAAEDRDEFAVWIWARKGAKHEKQKVFITPHPRLPSEFNVIEHVSAQPPDPASRFYMTFTEQDAGEFRFNQVTEDPNEPSGKQTVMTKKIEVSGVKLVIEQGGEDKASLYHRLKERTNLKELTLCADEVVIRCPLKVPGTDVTIWARTLRFEDAGNVNGQIDTSPLPIRTRSTKDIGLDGQKAGDVRLFVRNLVTPGNALRIVANGSAGQDARLGIPGAHGADKTPWNGKITVKPWTGIGETDLDFTPELQQASEGWTCIGADISRDGKHEFSTGKAEGPGNGEDPKVYPGRPGQGGDGGSITTIFDTRMATVARQKRGEMGDMAKDIPAARQGEPIAAQWVRAMYEARLGGVTKTGVKWNVRWGYSPAKQGKEGKAFPSDKPAAKAGLVHSPDRGGDGFWVHPATVRAVIPYASDAALTGHAEVAREILGAHLEGVKKVEEFYAKNKNYKTDVMWSALRAELEAPLQRLDSPYDYFGNPAGWVPMLSFQANYTLYENELESALRAMFLAYWVENKQARTAKAAKVREEALKRLRQETEDALKSYGTALDKVAYLDGEITGITLELGRLQTDLENRVRDMKRQAEDNLKVEHFWRSAAKILGGVMQLIPVGQPVLGAFGKTFTALGDIDVDNPSGSLGDLAGAWKKVGTEKIAPKFSKLFAGLTDPKEKKEKDEKDADFDKALAKKELAEKVSAHMKEQKEAKETVLGAFSGFAVSEDEVNERLKKVQSECPAYKDLVTKVEDLNKRKKAFAEEMFAAMQAIDAASATIINSQLAIYEVRTALDKTLQNLNLEALQYVRGMGQRARDRLLLYQYYLLKSYHYLMLDKLPVIDFRAQKIFDAFTKVLVEQPSGGKAETNLLDVSDDGMLNERQFKALKAVFDDQLRDIAQSIVVWYQGNTARTTGTFLLELTREELETLNGTSRRVEIDLLWHLNLRREDIRLTKIVIKSVKLAEPLPSSAVTLSLEYLHDGLTRVRRDGRLYLFRTGDFRAAAKGKDQGSKTYWSTDVKFDPDPNEGDKKLTLEESQIDPEAESLISHLIGDKGGKKSPLLSFRPSGWTTLAVSRSGDYRGKVVKLTLDVHYVYQRVDDSLATVVVKVGDGDQPFFRLDAADVNGRRDGQGSFVRTFANKKQKVRVSAPSQYGRRPLLGWRVASDPDVRRDGNADETPLKPGATLTLDLGKSPDYLVEAVYAPLDQRPIDDKDEEWPPCPAGWGFDDWVLTNGSSSPIRFSKLDCVPWRGGGAYTPAVNEPQGNNEVRLSFERISLMPGESTKISVCTNPEVEGSAGDQVMFSWEGDHAVFFDGAGKLSGLRRWRGEKWQDASAAFDLDRENRTVTFKRG